MVPEIPIARPEPVPEDDTVNKEMGPCPLPQSLESREEDGQSIRSLAASVRVVNWTKTTNQ